MSESIEKKGEKISIKRILVPIDGSDYSMRAAKYAIEIARLQNAEIFCIHIIQKLPYSYESIGSAIEEYIESIKIQARSWFDKITEMAKIEGIKSITTDIFIDVRSITDSIINYAYDKSIDIIILGTKGRTGLQRILLGSVASGILQHAHCAVLIVR